MSRALRPGLGGITGGSTGRSTGNLGAPGKRTLTQGLVQRKARTTATTAPSYEERNSGMAEGSRGGASADRAGGAIDTPAEWDESVGRPTLSIAGEPDAEGVRHGEAAAEQDESGWIRRARTHNQAHAKESEELDRLTWGACVGDDGSLDPRKVARWQAANGVRPDGRVGEVTLDAARSGGTKAPAADGDRATSSAATTIDAPARFDEVDRGTIALGEDEGLASREASATAVAPQRPLDRRAEQAATSIDAPPTYDEDRGTLDVGTAVRDAPRVASAVQRKAGVSGAGSLDADEHAIAASGVAGASSSLPHLGVIQASFGRHDVSHVRAAVGGAAATASEALGAEAYATGANVAFRESPSLHIAAHEAAHVIQQQAGVQLKGGIGEAGDAYEQHADAVADAVVRGESAEGLLASHQGGGAAVGVQRKVSARASRLLDEATTLYGSIRDQVEQLARESTGPAAKTLGASIQSLLLMSDEHLKQLRAADLDSATVAKLEKLEGDFSALEARAASLLAKHGMKPRTGAAIVDKGFGCEHTEMAGCYLDDDGRELLLHSLQVVVQSSIDNYRDAIANTQIDRVAEQQPSSWGFLAEFLFYAVTGPLIGAALTAFKDFAKVAKAADAPAKFWRERGTAVMDPKGLTAAIGGLSEEVLTLTLQNASKGLRQHLKNQAHTGGGKSSDISFLRHLQDKLKDFTDTLLIDAPTQLSDVGLVGLYHSYRDSNVHSVSAYEGRVQELLRRFNDQGLSTLNKKFQDGGRRRAIVLKAYGKQKTAILDEHGTGASSHRHDNTSWGKMDGGTSYGDGVDKLHAIVDDDLASLAADLSEGSERVVDVSHWALAEEPSWTIEGDESDQPFKMPSWVRDDLRAWAKAAKAEHDDRGKVSPKPVVTHIPEDDPRRSK